MIDGFKAMKSSGDGPFNQDTMKAKMDAKVFTIVTKEPDEYKPAFDTKPEDSGSSVPSNHEYITDAKEDVQDMAKGADMSPYISSHMKGFVSAIEFDFNQQVSQIKDIMESTTEDMEDEEDEEHDLEQATEVLKEELEMVDSKAKSLIPTIKSSLRSATKKPIAAKDIPKIPKGMIFFLMVILCLNMALNRQLSLSKR